MGLLRKWFGPSKEEIWRQLSAKLGAEFKKGRWTGDLVKVRHGEWILTLDTYVVSTGKTTIIFTRMRAPYVNREGFRFTIYRRGWFSEIAKFFGMQDVEVGQPELDEPFIIKGTSETTLRALFDDARLRELLVAQPKIHLTVKDHEGWFGPDFPEDTDELCFHVVGVIKDLERLEQLFELFAVTLDRLCRIGAAYERAPGVEL